MGESFLQFDGCRSNTPPDSLTCPAEASQSKSSSIDCAVCLNKYNYYGFDQKLGCYNQLIFVETSKNICENFSKLPKQIVLKISIFKNAAYAKL